MAWNPDYTPKSDQITNREGNFFTFKSGEGWKNIGSSPGEYGSIWGNQSEGSVVALNPAALPKSSQLGTAGSYQNAPSSQQTGYTQTAPTMSAPQLAQNPSQQASTQPVANMTPTAPGVAPTAPVATTGTAPNMTYQNPTQVTQSTKTFGESDQFNIDPFINQFGFQQQKGENSNYLNEFTNFLGSQETIPQIQQRYENQYGIPALRESVLRGSEAMDDVMNRIRNTPESIAGRSQNSILTQGQLDAISNKEVKGLMEVYNGLGQITEQQGKRLAMAEQNLNDAAKLEMAQQQKMTTPWLQRYDLDKIMQAREFSGWTFANQIELQRLQSNQQAGLTWTNAQRQRAHELTMQQNSFSHQLNMLEKQNEFALDLWG